MKMSVFLVLSLMLVMQCCVTASFDIAKLLSQYPAYSTFSNYLTQTQLATEINARQTITVLAVENAAMAPISGKPMDLIKKIMSIHVLLDYFDSDKLQSMANQNITVTTLFQTTGQAQRLQGFLKITQLGTGAVAFLSAEDPNAAGSNFIKDVVSQPYDISVLQVSALIMPPSLVGSASSPLLAKSPAPVPVMSPVPVVSAAPVTVVAPVPVFSAAPIVSPVPVVSPMQVPVASPVPVSSPMPVVSPVPVSSPTPVVSPVPVSSPVPVVSPVPVSSPMPVVSPVPVSAPVPVISPVPAVSPAPVPVNSPVPAVSPAPGPGGDGPAADSSPSDEAKSGVAQYGVNWALVTAVTLISINMNMMWRPIPV